MKFNHKEEFERLYEDNEIWFDFVENWIKKHPDEVIDVVEAYLTKQLNENNWSVVDEYNEWVNNAVEDKYGELVDRAYESYRDDEKC